MSDPRSTILIVDDEPAVRRIAVRVLQRAGYECLEAADGREAFKLWQEQRDVIALVVTDVMMPNQNGWELVLAVRGAGSRVPFVVTSGHDASAVVPPGVGDGVMIVGKPWEAAQLVATVKQLIG